jgi:DNA-binding transcriptional MerR regulator
MSAGPVAAKTSKTVNSFTISQLAAEFNVTARTLRFYEDKGLLLPARKGQTRIYSVRDRAKLKLILQGKRIGLPLDEIKDMMGLYELRSNRPEELRATVITLKERIAFLKTRKGDIEQAITELNQTCALVEDLLRPR